MSHFGRNLRSERVRVGKSAEQMAADLGISKHAIHNWECGRSIPRIDDAKMLADYFGCPIDRLIDPATPPGLPESLDSVENIRSTNPHPAPSSPQNQGENANFMNGEVR
jgi:transcriptional regulator with XRE-family HTH domain